MNHFAGVRFLGNLQFNGVTWDLSNCATFNPNYCTCQVCKSGYYKLEEFCTVL